MIDRIFCSALTFCLFVTGALFIASAVPGQRHSITVAQAKVVQLERVVVVGKRLPAATGTAAATAVAETEATDPTPQRLQ